MTENPSQAGALPVWLTWPYWEHESRGPWDDAGAFARFLRTYRAEWVAMRESGSWRCPKCAGPWAGWLTFDHASPCELGRADDATTYADHTARADTGARITRDPTATEHELFTALAGPTARLDAVTVLAVPGLHVRITHATTRPEAVA
jgi:hypothetical protein